MNIKVLLQLKFLLVAFLNVTYTIVPNPLRKFYLSCFGFRLGKKSYIHRKCKFFHVGKLTVGDCSVINFGCYLDNRRGIKIGNNVGIAHNVKIYTLGHDVKSSKFETKGAPVIIKDDVFIYSNVLIMPGVTINQGAIVLPGSVVVKDVPSRKIYGGNPAKEVGERKTDIDYIQSYGYWFAL